jgi:Fe2+ transport system protein FeoA
LTTSRPTSAASRLEHALSEELEAKIDESLGDPTHDPHGDPIPDAALNVEPSALRPLASLRAGEEATICRVPGDDAELLRYLSSLELLPGRRVQVRASAPLDAPVTIAVGSREHAIAHEVAAGDRRYVAPDRPPRRAATRAGITRRSSGASAGLPVGERRHCVRGQAIEGDLLRGERRLGQPHEAQPQPGRGGGVGERPRARVRRGVDAAHDETLAREQLVRPMVAAARAAAPPGIPALLQQERNAVVTVEG